MLRSKASNESGSAPCLPRANLRASMPAQQQYITSILQSFSTFLAVRNIQNRSAEDAMLVLVEYLKQTSASPTWTLEEVTQYINSLSQVSRDAKNLVHEFLIAHPPHQTNVFLNDFLLALLHDNCSASTIKNYRSDIGQFIHFCQISDLRTLLQKPNVLAFLKNEADKGLKSSSLKRKLASITQFALWAEEHELSKTISPWLTEISADIDKLLINQPAQAQQKPKHGSFKHWAFPIESHAEKLRETIWRNPFAASRGTGTARDSQELRTKLKAGLASITQSLQIRTQAWMLPYLNLAMIVLFFLGAAYFGYLQFFRDAPEPLAYPSSLTRPNRTLSFQGRLTDTAQNPITTATDLRFRLYDSGPSTVGGTELWDSGTCSITPDQDGIFATGLGDDCGTEITNDVFTENSNVWLQVEVETEVLDPRQQIKTVAYALNSETLQGFPASTSATESTVVVMDEFGNVTFGSASPILQATGNSFAIEANSLELRTTPGSNGDITLNPDGTGDINLLADINLSGYLYAPGATLSATYAGGTALVTRGGPSGTANIQEWQNNAGTALSVVDELGNIGIGTSNPGTKLNVAGGIWSQISADAGNSARGIQLTPAAFNGDQSIIGWGNSGGALTVGAASTGTGQRSSTTVYNPQGYITFNTSNSGAGTEKVRIDAIGNVGIGSTGPSSQLTVSQRQDSDAFAAFGYDDRSSNFIKAYVDASGYGYITTLDQLRLDSGNNTIYAVDRVYLADGTYNYANTHNRYAAGATTYSLGGESTNNTFQLIKGTTLNTDVILAADTNGNLGIGTVSPTAFLDIAAASAAKASVRVRTGSAPSSPNEGDIYADGTDIFYYDGSTWVDLTLGGTGTGWWDNTLNVLHPKNEFAGVVDLVVGGTSTASADFQVIGSGANAGNFFGRTFTDIDNASYYIDLNNTGTSALFAGSVGIGTTAATRDLDVRSSTTDFIANFESSDDQAGITIIDDDTDFLYGIKGTSFFIDRTTSFTSPDDFVIDNSGNIGMGTSAPSARLTLNGVTNLLDLENNGGAADTQLRYLDNGIAEWQINRVDSTNTLNITESGIAARMTFLPGGNVGIGTTNPINKLHISQSASGLIVPQLKLHVVASADDGSEGTSIDFVASSDPTAVGSRIVATRQLTGAHMDLRFHTGRDSERMRIDEAGDVGIGVTSPDFPLQVDGTIAPETTDQDLGTSALRWDLFANAIDADSTVTLTGLTGGTDNTVLILNASNQVATDEIDPKVWGTDLVDSAGGTTNYLTKWTSGGETIGDSLVFDDGTNVGIGTTIPSQKFEVKNGNVRITNATTGTGVAPLIVQNTNAYASPYTQFSQVWLDSAGSVMAWMRNDGTFNMGGSQGQIRGTMIQLNSIGAEGSPVINTGTSYNSGLFFPNSGQDIGFTSVGSEKMRITTAGNVGIGTSNPSTFKLEVAGDIGPTVDSTYSLGSSGRAWLDIYGDNLYQNGNEVCDISGNCPTGAWFENTANVLHPRNEYAGIADLVIGGNSTASADFQVIGSGANAGYVYGRRFIDIDSTNYYVEPGNTTTAGLFAGNVGIGTTSSNASLEVSRSDDSSILRLQRTTQPAYWDFRISNGAYYSHDLRISPNSDTSSISFENAARTAATLHMRPDTLRVGINDTSPDFRLESVGSSGSGYFGITNSTDGDIFMINSNGNVGVGTTTPQQKLQVDGVTISGDTTATQGSLGFGIRYTGNDILNTFGSAFSSADTVIGSAVKPKSGSAGYVSSADNAAFTRGALRIGDDLEFLNAGSSTTPVGNDVTLTSRFMITASGSVGIGTTNPASALDVAVGDITLQNDEYISNSLDDVVSLTGAGGADNTDLGIDLDGIYPRLFSTTDTQIGIEDSLEFVGAQSITTSTGNLTIAPAAGNDLLVNLSTTGDFIVNTDDLFVDTSAGFVGIGSTSPTTTLDVVGNINATTGYYYGGTSSPLSLELTRTLPTTVNDYVEIGNFNLSNGAHNVRLSVTVPSAANSVAKTYIVPVKYGQTSAAWQLLSPIASTGPYSGQDFEVDVNVTTNIAYFRIRRSAGTTAGTAYVRIESTGYTADTFTATTGTGTTTAPTAVFSSTPLAAVQGNVGIGTTAPTSLLSVGLSEQFKVGSDGDIDAIKNLAYSWPTAHSSNAVLVNNGSGTLTWSTVGASGVTADSLDFTEFQDDMDLDATTNIDFANFSYIFDLDGTGDFIIQDAGVEHHVFYDNGDIRLGNNNELYLDTDVGYVGIGTFLPSSKFHIYENINSSVNTIVQNPNTGSIAYAQFIAMNNASTQAMFGIGSSATSAQYASRAYVSSTGGVSLIGTSTGDIRLFTNTTSERMRIASDGNVGIGTTTIPRLLTVNGPMRLNTTSIPGSPASGDMYSDGTNLYYYNGTGWDDLTASGTNYWGLTANVLHPRNEYAAVADFVIGGTSTASADFQVIGSGANAGYVSGRRFIDIDSSSYYVEPGDTTTAGLFAGNVGINTTVTSAKLDVVGDIELANYLYFDNAATEYIRWDSSNFLVSDDILPVTDDAQDLGATGSRWRDLYLGPDTLHIGSSLTDEGTISYDTTSNIFNFGTDATSNGDIAFFTDDLYLDKSSGNVGINTTSTLQRLTIAGSGSTARLATKDTATAGLNAQGGFEMYDSANSRVGFNVMSTGIYWLGTDVTGGSISLRVNDNDIEGLTIQSDGDVIAPTGNVGIGTTAPGISAGGGIHLTLSEDTWSTANRPTLEFDNPSNSITDGGRLAQLSVYAGTAHNEVAGIYSDAVGVSENAARLEFWTATGGTLTERMRIDEAGNIGIGTTTTSSFKLDVAGNVGPSTDSTYDLGSGSKAWANIYADTLYQNGNVVCDDSGNCPNISWFQNTANVLHPKNEYASVVDLVLGGTSTASADIRLGSDGTGYFASNVGIGTTNATGLLTVQNGDIRLGSNDAGGNGRNIWWRNRSDMGVQTSGYSVGLASPDNIVMHLDSNSNNANDTYFAINKDSGSGGNNTFDGGTNLFKVVESGNVGIGSTAPTQLLDISKSQNAGTWAFVQNATSGTDATAGFSARNGSKGVSLTYRSAAYTIDPAWADAGGVRTDTTVTGGLILSAGGANDLKFETNDVERMRIDSTGNVGIGTASPTYFVEAVINNDSYQSMRMQNTSTGTNAVASVQAANTTGSLAMGKLGTATTGFSGYGSPGDTFLYSSSGGGSDFNIINAYATGAIDFFVGSGAAGSVDMTIQPSGNVGIGTGTVTSGYTLDVQGNQYLQGDLVLDNNSVALYNTNNISGGPDIKIFSNGVFATEGNLYLNIDSDNGSADSLFIGHGAETSAATTIMTIRDTGNVGIGTTTTDQRLSISGNINMNDGIIYNRSTAGNVFGIGMGVFGGTELAITSDNIIDFTESDGSVIKAHWELNNGTFAFDNAIRAYDADGLYLQDDAGNNGIYILDGGNVSIGTTYNETEMYVQSGANTSGIEWVMALKNPGNALVTGYGTGLQLKQGQTTEHNKWSGIAAVADSTYANTSGLAFYANESEEMRINGGGNIGMGTTSAAASLHIYRPDADYASLALTGGNQGTGMVFVGQSMTHGGGMTYNGDGTPATVGTTDNLSFFVRNASTDTEVLRFPYNSTTGYFAGTIDVANDIYFDTNNNYISYPDGDYGSLMVGGDGKGTWEGFSINGRYVFMSDDNNHVGLYNDVNNRWILSMENASYTRFMEPDSTAEAMRIAANGSLNIGTTAGSGLLNVQGSGYFANDGAGTVTRLNVTNNNATANSQAEVQIDWATNYWAIFGKVGNSGLQFWDGNDTQVRFDADASGKNDNGWATAAVDFAEYYEKVSYAEHIEAGDVVAIKNGKVTKDLSGEHAFVSVISTAPGFAGGVDIYEDGSLSQDMLPQKYQPVAKVGQVPIKVTTEAGNITEGDAITHGSAYSGFGVQAETADYVIGRAMENFPYASCTPVNSVNEITWVADDPFNKVKECYVLPNGTKVGKIMMYVNMTWYDPVAEINNQGMLAMTQAFQQYDSTLQSLQSAIAANTASITGLNDTTTGLIAQVGSASAHITNLTNRINTLEKQATQSASIKRLGVGVAAPATDSGKLIDTSAGAFLSEGGVWTNVSDATKKENFTTVDADTILDKISALPITQWNYIAEDDTVTHIGPTAQDFHAAFGLGKNNTTVSTIDPAGVALAGIQALAKDVKQTHFDDAGQLIIQENQYGEFEVATTKKAAILDSVLGAADAVFGSLRAGSAKITKLSVDTLEVGGASFRDAVRNVVREELATQNNEPSNTAEKLLALSASPKPSVTPNPTPASIPTEPAVLPSELELIDGADDDSIALSVVGDVSILGDLSTATLSAQEASIAGVSTEKLDAASARITALEAGMAQLQHIKAQTAEFTTATISGTLYADSIDKLEERIEATLKKPSLIDALLNKQTTTVPEADPQVVEMVVEHAGYDVEPEPTLPETADTLEELQSEEPDAELTSARLFVEEYFELNGTGFVAQSLGIGDSLFIGNGMEISEGHIAYAPEGIERPELKIQSTGVGSVNFLAGVMVIEDTGTVGIQGDLTVSGAIAAAQVKTNTLLTNLIQPTEFGTPFQVQVAGISTASGEVKKSRFEIINESGEAVAAFDADGNAEFSGGIKVSDISVAQEQLTDQEPQDDTVTTSKSSGTATLKANKDKIIINTDKVKGQSLVYVTPKSSTENKVLYIKQQQDGQFEVGFDGSIGKDVEFNWWIVN